jgi:hypothetical protein
MSREEIVRHPQSLWIAILMPLKRESSHGMFTCIIVVDAGRARNGYDDGRKI